MRQLIASDEATPCSTQPKKPCSDCPFARAALPGWLGTMSVKDWERAILGESMIDCHTLIGPQCAGAAILRANICKVPRDKKQLRLEPDEKLVFSDTKEFRDHHTKRSDPVPEDSVRCDDCGGTYVAGAPHYMFCPVKMCSECGTTVSYILPVEDEDDLDVDGNPIRLCEECK
jgi:hypothetical protein